ncbi:MULTISPECIES: DUF5304 domain-containing protein [unclassified Streptomyces]|uniref:DUF5304 domain-containing protein n=1 Tax=unclassified Streptomyces TaxID=2593676 RepID=UPI0005A790AA|nr:MULTISPECIES: DUF5304 domain-containing protein [unclassified Streptomyces]ODA73778.1 hypothetical protein APS67_002045 [Streptomyces sp. AVP053U2]
MSEQLPPPDDTGDAPVGGSASDARTAAVGDARPGDAGPRAVDADAWATACAEDLEAESARRRARYGPPPASAAEELRKLVDVVAEKFDQLTGGRSPLFGAVAGPAAQQAVRQVVQQAKAAVEPVVERNPDVFDHLAAAGNELLAAYRSAVQDQERRWTTRDPRPWDPDEAEDAPGAEDAGGGSGKDDRGNGGDAGDDRRRNRGDEPGPGGERIDLD